MESEVTPVSLDIVVTNEADDADSRTAPEWRWPFGGEATRATIWGSRQLKALGLIWLPKLAEQPWIEVQDEDLAELEKEARILRDHVDAIAATLPYVPEYVSARVDFLLEACAMARSLGPAGTVRIG
jgi:hypothetical protein